MSFSFPLAYLSFEGCYFFQAAKIFLFVFEFTCRLLHVAPFPLLSSSLNILSELGVKNELVRSLAFLRATPVRIKTLIVHRGEGCAGRVKIRS